MRPAPFRLNHTGVVSVTVAELYEAIENRALVRIDERNGWAQGMVGIAMGVSGSMGTDSVKVGFVDEHGYTGEYTRVSVKHLEMV